MSTRDVDRLLTTWLTADAPGREPDHLLEQVLARTARTRRRPGWVVPERWLSVQLTMRWQTVPRFTPILVVLALLIALVAAVVLSGGPRLPPPFGLAANGRLIYATSGDLFVRDSWDGPERPLVVGEAMDFAPLISADGTRIAFWRMIDASTDRMALWTGRADGADVHALAEFTTMDWFSWAPDGRTIAVTEGQEGATSLSFIDTADGRVTRMDLGFSVTQPAWRPPDGRQLLVRGIDADGVWGFWLIERDGAVISRLDLDPGFQEDRYYDTEENEKFYFLDPAWSHDGSMLAFHSLEPTIADDDPGFRVHVATVSQSGTVAQERILLTDPDVDDVWQAAWLPGGDGIVVRTYDEGRQAVVVHRLDGTAGRQIGPEHRNPEYGDLAFVVSPDGREVIAWSFADDLAWRIDVAAGTHVPFQLVTDEYPTWQRTAS